MGRHIIIGTENGQRVRFRGVFTDEQFFGLPLVKQFGCFPAGHAAAHFGDEDGVGSEHWLSLPESERDAVDVLRELLRGARTAAYAVVKNGEPVSYHPSQKKALAELRHLVHRWRRDGDHRHQQTAVSCSGPRAPEGAVQGYAFELRRRIAHRTVSVALLCVKPTCTGAVVQARAIRGEVA